MIFLNKLQKELEYIKIWQLRNKSKIIVEFLLFLKRTYNIKIFQPVDIDGIIQYLELELTEQQIDRWLCEHFGLIVKDK